MENFKVSILINNMKAIKKPVEIDFYEIKTLSSYDIGEMTKWIRTMGENPDEILDIIFRCELQ